MALLTLRGVRLSYSGPALLDGVDLQIEAGERICLVGRNGTGKSTFMKVIAGELGADEGEIVRRQGLKLSRLTQEVPRDLSGTIYEVVASGLPQGKIVSEYHQLSQQLADDLSLMKQFERVQQELEACGGWELQQQVDTILSRLQLPPEADFSALSGGMKRRVLLARALANSPDLLLLDEPTNHLDIDAIRWLEEFLLSYSGTLLFITHDRALLEKLATRIIELDRGHLTSWPGNYQTYLERKQAALDAEASQNAEFDKKLAQEEAWIRQGIKARRTRNEGRVRALEAMREEHRARRQRSGTAKIQLQESAERSGKLVMEAEDVSYSYGDKPVVAHLSTTILRGDKVGIIGPNGAGKTTLLRLLLGQLQPQQGTIKLGTKLEVAYFDQYRAQLNEEQSVLDNVSQGRSTVTINGQSRHIISYLQDFLFSPERARTPVRALSGGERNRLLLARLFTHSANILVMDEPTNDLDMETLELLEELLLDYKGTLLLVSHDRAFLNRVVTSTLVFEGDGRINDYVGGYDDWLRQRPTPPPASPPPNTTKQEATTTTEPKSTPPKKSGKKLSYKDQRELDELPARIEALEAEIAHLHETMAEPDFYQKGPQVMAETQARLESEEAALATAYERWDQLEAMRTE